MRKVIKKIFWKQQSEENKMISQDPFNILRSKWVEVPAGNNRISTKALINTSDQKLLEKWLTIREQASTGSSFNVRGWYHLLYKDILKEKKVLDVGSGLGIDGITFAQHGARVTFVDIVQSNLSLLQRLCELLNLTNVDFCYMENISSLSVLPNVFDVIWCQGSLINAPFEIIHEEAQEILKHLPVGGRWVELAYPKERWEKEGRMPFDKWGKKTNGGAPWIEWYDLEKMFMRLAPAKFDVVLYFNYHNDDFNWFDLRRIA